jgi:hypothetical protein
MAQAKVTLTLEPRELQMLDAALQLLIRKLDAQLGSPVPETGVAPIKVPWDDPLDGRRLAEMLRRSIGLRS